VFWNLLDELCLLSLKDSKAAAFPNDPNRYIAAYKSIHDFCTGKGPSQQPVQPAEIQHHALYCAIRKRLSRHCDTCVGSMVTAASEAGELEEVTILPTPQYTNLVGTLAAMTTYLDRHWIAMMQQVGEDKTIVPVADMALTQWELAVQRRRLVVASETDSATTSGDVAAATAAAAEPPRTIPTTGTLKLETTGPTGARLCEMPCAVASLLFPVLGNLVDDLGLSESELATTTIPLDAAACPPEAVQRLVALGVAIAGEDAVEMVEGDVAMAERLCDEHRVLLGASVDEIVQLIMSANFLGSAVIVDVGCFALGTALVELYPKEALAFCFPKETSGAGGGGAGERVARSDAGAIAAPGASTAAESAAEQFGIPISTDDGSVTLVPLQAVRMMRAVQPVSAQTILV
jgi:hypothetical protein